MAGYIIGVGLLAYAVSLWKSGRAPARAIEFTGTVVEEVSRKSTQAGRRTRTYAPRVAYQHPKTGADEVFDPTRFGSERFIVGERTVLFYDPRKDAVRRPLDRPVRNTAVMTVLGLGFIAAQFFAR